MFSFVSVMNTSVSFSPESYSWLLSSCVSQSMPVQNRVLFVEGVVGVLFIWVLYALMLVIFFGVVPPSLVYSGLGRGFCLNPGSRVLYPLNSCGGWRFLAGRSYRIFLKKNPG